MAKYCECKIKPRAYRQAAVAISREYIPPHVHPEGSTNIVEEKVGHGEAMGHEHYGLSVDDIPSLTQDSIFLFRRIDHWWHDVTGFGRKPVPGPLRFASSSPPVVPDLQDLEGIVDKSVAGTISKMQEMIVGKVLQDLEGVINKCISATMGDMQETLIGKVLPMIEKQVTESIDRLGINATHNSPTLSLPPSSLDTSTSGEESGTSMSDPFSYSEQTTTSASSLSNTSSSIIEITDSEETYQSSTQDIAPLRRPWKGGIRWSPATRNVTAAQSRSRQRASSENTHMEGSWSLPRQMTGTLQPT
jgi:hypothetical protein